MSVTAGLSLIIYGLGEAQSAGWTSPSTLIAVSLAPLLFIAFGLVERRSADPLVPFALLRRRAAVGNVLATLQSSTAAATVFLAPLYMQQVWGFSPLQAGAASLPLPFGYALGARVSSRLVSRVGTKQLVCAGFLLLGGGALWLARSPVHASYVSTFLPALFIRTVGQALVVVPIVVTLTSGVDKGDQGITAGLFNMSQQLGGTIGLAVIATVAAAASAVGGSHVAAEAHGIRVAFLACGLVAIVGCLLALSSLQAPGNVLEAAPTDVADMHPIDGRCEPHG